MKGLIGHIGINKSPANCAMGLLGNRSCLAEACGTSSSASWIP